MSAKTRAILQFSDMEDSLIYINNLVRYIKKTQKTLFDEYIDRNKIHFYDHRSYDDIRKVKVEYLSGNEIDTSFFITTNIPRYESRNNTVSIWNNNDHIATDLFCMRAAITKTVDISNEIPITTNDSKLLWLESTYSDVSPTFITMTMDNFKQVYYINTNTNTSTFRKNM